VAGLEAVVGDSRLMRVVLVILHQLPHHKVMLAVSASVSAGAAAAAAAQVQLEVQEQTQTVELVEQEHYPQFLVHQ